MALTHFAPTLWAAALYRALDEASVYRMLVNRSYEADARTGAKTINIQSIDNDVNVGNYTIGTDITDPQVMDSGQRQLVMDQQVYFNVKVDDIRRVQSNSDIMGEVVRKAAVAMAQTVDTFLSATRMGAAVVEGNKVQPTFTIPTTTAHYATLGGVLIDSLLDVLQKMEEANIDDMTPKWAVVSPKWARGLREWFKTNSNDMYLPSTQEMMLRTGMLGTLAGMTLYRSNRTEQVQSFDSVLCGTNAATTHATQIDSIETIRMEKQFADMVRGLMVYGALVIDTNQLFRIEKKA